MASCVEIDRCNLIPISITSLCACPCRPLPKSVILNRPNSRLNLGLLLKASQSQPQPRQLFRLRPVNRRLVIAVARAESEGVGHELAKEEADKVQKLSSNEHSNLDHQQKSNQLQKRIVFGIGIGVSVGGVVLAGGWVFTVALAAAVFVGASEYFELVRSRGITEGMTPPPRYVSRVCSVICALMPILTLYFGHIDVSITSAAFIVVMALLLQRGNPRFAQLSGTMFGLFYYGYLPCFWVKLRCGLAAPALNTRLNADQYHDIYTFYRYGGTRGSASFSNVSMFFPKLFPMEGGTLRTSESRASRIVEKLKSTNGDKSNDIDTDSDCENENDKQENNHHILDEKTKYELKKKIREALATKPDVKEELDPEKRKKMMEEFVSEHPLVVEEEDPTWTDEDDGWGFNLDQFFNKVTIKNVRKDDDEDYDSENEMVWEDDDFVRPIKDITTLEWEETVFKDISPLIVFVHNRYRRPEEDEKLRDELVKAVTIISDCNLPVPRCVALDALAEVELVDALGVSVYPELIFTKAGRILYREKAIRNADELSKIMAFFYYGAAKPPYLNIVEDSQETVPSAPRKNPHLL